MAMAVQELISILDLERLEVNLFRGQTPDVGWQRVFGGQVIAQALVAAQKTVASGFFVHSLHGYFMLPGDPTVPIIYEVDPIREGRSFLTRRVNAIQHGKAIFSLAASFQRDEAGLEHQMEMPKVAQPEDLLSEKELIAQFIDQLPDSMRRYWERERPIEMKPVNPQHYVSRKKQTPSQDIWIRATGTIPDNRPLQAAVLAYISDMTLLDTATFPHGRAVFDPDLQMASLDHSMWFHNPSKINDWMLYSQDTPFSGGSRGLSRGLIFSQDGTLIASVAQEGLMRLKTPKGTKSK